MAKAVPAGIAALSASLYLTSALGMNLYIAENVNAATAAKSTHVTTVLTIVKDSTSSPR